MTDGEAYRSFNRRNEDLVLVEGPQSPSFSREARWPMGVSCFLLGRRRRANVSAPMGKVLSRADRRVLTEKVIQHRDEIFREWEEKVQQ